MAHAKTSKEITNKAVSNPIVERGSGMKINQFIDRQMKLWNMEFDKLKAAFAPYVRLVVASK